MKKPNPSFILFFKKINSVVLLLIISFSLHAQDTWTHFYKGDDVNEALETATDLWIASTVGLVKINKATEEKEIFNYFNSSLLNHNIRGILQDHSGTIWIKTRIGVAYLEESEWIFFTPDNSILEIDDKGIPNTDKIYVDAENRIWTNNNNRILYYSNNTWHLSYETDGFTNMFFRVSRNGTAWIRETGSNGNLRRFEDGNWVIEDSNLPNEIYPTSAFWFGENSENNTFFSCTPYGILRWNTFEKTWTYFPQDSTIEFTGNWRTIDSENNVWMFNQNEQSFIKFSESNNWEVIPIQENQSEIFIKNIAPSSDGIWFTSYFGSQLDSLGKVNLQNEFEWIDVPDEFTYPNLSMKELSDGSLFLGASIQQPAIFKDNQFNTIDFSNAEIPSDLIIDIVGEGEPDQIVFNSYHRENLVNYNGGNWTTINYPNGYYGSWDSRPTIKENGDIWFNGYNGQFQGISIYANDVWENLDIQSQPFYDIKIEELEIAPDQSVWLETDPINSIFNYKNEVWKEYHFPDYGLPSQTIDILGFDNENQLWIIFDYNYNIYLLNNATDSFDLVIQGQDIFSIFGWNSSQSMKMTQLENGNIIFMKIDRVIEFDGTNFTIHNNTNAPIPIGTEFYDIKKDSSDNVWIASTHGVFKFDGETWEAFNVTNSPLADNWVTSLFIDHDNKIWITCWKGGLLTLLEDPNYTSLNAVSSPFDFSFNIFPNPIISQAIVSFELEKKATVQVEIYDTTGKLISTLFFGKKSIGNHQIEIDLSEFPQGIYFCKLNVDQQSDVLKLVKISR